MAQFKKIDENYCLLLDKREAIKLGLDTERKYEIQKVKDHLFMVMGKESFIEKQILEILESVDPKSRIEGSFEKMLDSKCLQTFNEMQNQGRIVKVKLDPKQKPVYKSLKEMQKEEILGSNEDLVNNACYLPQEKEGKGNQGNAGNKNKKPEIKKEVSKEAEHFADYSLEKNGYLVVKNEFRVKELSQQLHDEIKNGEIVGMKGFDGTYYIIESDLYQNVREKCVNELMKGEKNLQELSENLKMTKELVKGVCEFLKEDGEIIEKRKESFKYIE